MASNVGEEGAIPRRSEVSTYFSSIASVVGGADPIEGLVMTSGGTPEGLYTPEKGPSEGKEKRGDVDFVVVSASDPGLLVRPPRVGDGKLEHDKERRLGVAGDLEAVIAVGEKQECCCSNHAYTFKYIRRGGVRERFCVDVCFSCFYGLITHV